MTGLLLPSHKSVSMAAGSEGSDSFDPPAGADAGRHKSLWFSFNKAFAGARRRHRSHTCPGGAGETQTPARCTRPRKSDRGGWLEQERLNTYPRLKIGAA